MFPSFTLEHWEVIIASAAVAGAVVTSVFVTVCAATCLLTREHGHATAAVPKVAPAADGHKVDVRMPAMMAG